MSVIEKIKDPFANRELERISAELLKQAALADYIAMMADIEIPFGEEEQSVVL